MDTDPTDIDGYLAAVPEDARVTLEKLRQVIRVAVPEAVESISYGMPTFKYRERPLIYFSAAKAHCAIYGTSAGTLRFQPGNPPSDETVMALLTERTAAIESTETGRRRTTSDPGSG